MVRRGDAGFTLIEILTVVVIIGVLAAVAVVSYSKSNDDVKVTTEVNSVFMAFKLAQEAYVSENNGYLATGNGESAIYPTTPGPSRYNIESDSNYPAEWKQLGLNLTKPFLRCGYVSIVGDAGDATNVGNIATSFNFTPPDEDWFYIVAQCDMDGDGNFATFFTHSATSETLERNRGE